MTDATAAHYQLQVATDPEFTTLVLYKTWVTPSWYTPTAGEALFPGIYYWRVRALDALGNAGAWTSGWSFTVTT